jgi:3-phosphoshikimate 1-carboxyvinyltransferase
MNADIKLENKHESCEPYADIVVKSSILRATEVRAEEIPSLVDEIPILCVAAVFAKGRTVIRGVNELRVKETNRIDSISANLKKVGAKVLVEGTPRSPALSIKGPGVFNLKDFHFESFGDHRTAMSAIVLGSNMESVFYIDDIKCINKSFPQFIPLFESLQHAG